MLPPTLGEDSAQLQGHSQLLLSQPSYRINPASLVASKLGVRSIAAPTWNRAPPAVHGRPSAPVCRELVAGSSCGSDRSPGWRGPRARAQTRAHSPAHTPASSLPAPHPPRGSSAGWGGGVTSGLQSRGERLERAARSSPSWEAGGALGRPRSALSSAPAVALPARGGASRAARWIESRFLGRTERVLQTWQALKLQLGQKRPSGGAGRGAPCAASLGGWGRSQPSAAAGPRPLDSGPGRARPVETSQPYAFRGCSGAGNASAPAPGHRRGAAACRKARRGKGAAASARSKCSRSLRRFPSRSPGASGRLIPCPRSLRIADLPATLAGREGERHGRVEDAGRQGRVGSRWSQGSRSSTCAEERARNRPWGSREGRGLGRDKVEVGCHTYSGDLGAPSWSGEPGGSQRLKTGESRKRRGFSSGAAWGGGSLPLPDHGRPGQEETEERGTGQRR